MAPPRTDLYGQFVFGDYFRQLNNLNQIIDVLDVMLPVQEMSKFQRRIRDFEFTLQLLAGQKGLVQAIVPNDETWRILWAGIANGDSGSKFTVLDITPRNLAKVGVVVSSRDVAPGAISTLYPSSTAGAGTTENEARTGPPYDAFPGDRVRINDITGTTAVGPISWTAYMRYEVMPPPVRADRDTEFVATVIP